MTQRELEQVRAQLSALRNSALSVVEQASAILAALPSEPPPPPKAPSPADSLDGLSFAGG